jgi:hypothetical protein
MVARHRHEGSEAMLSTRLILASAVLLALAGCEMIGNIFEAGVWTGIIGLVIIVAIVLFIVGRMRR